jgi:phosphotransferase system enzyme I (PtsP)
MDKSYKGDSVTAQVVIDRIVVVEENDDLSCHALGFINKEKSAIKKESKQWRSAVEATKAELSTLLTNQTQQVKEESEVLFKFYAHLLDESLGMDITIFIKKGWSAKCALKQVVEAHLDKFSSIDDDYIKERMFDIKDLGEKLYRHLSAEHEKETRFPKSFIALAKEISASKLLAYQAKGLKGMVLTQGTKHSHTALIAKAMDIPALFSVSDLDLVQVHGHVAIIDGKAGVVHVNPSEDKINHYQAKQTQTQTQEKIPTAYLPTETIDGHFIDLQLNVGVNVSANQNQRSIGLYRSEYYFLGLTSLPEESEQVAQYEAVLKNNANHTVTMRTLDVGGDKLPSYLSFREENPFLGCRGLRYSLKNPALFTSQIRAMLMANRTWSNLSILLPMVTNIEDVDIALTLIDDVFVELAQQNLGCSTKPHIGVMIEVPALLFQLEVLAQKVDFFSVGSNDLTQYLMAADRNNAQVASYYDFYNPSVLKALYHIANEANKYDVPLSICGDIAGQPQGAILLMAMGYQHLSIEASEIASIDRLIRISSFDRAREILNDVLEIENTEQIHAYLCEQFKQNHHNES